MKSFTSRSTLMSAATIGIGLAVGYMVLPAVCKFLPATWTAPIKSATGWGKARGLVNVALGITLYSMRNRNIKTVGMVIAGTGVYDLLAVNLPMLHLPQLPTENALLGSNPSMYGGSYLPLPQHTVAGSYGTPSYGMGTSYMGGSYESPAMKAFGDDFGLD